MVDRVERGTKLWGWRVISERVLENSRLVRARVFQKGSSNSQLVLCCNAFCPVLNTQEVRHGAQNQG